MSIILRPAAGAGATGPAGPTGPTGPTGPAGPAASVATDTIFDAKGDLPAGTGADTAAKLPAGSNGQFLSAQSGQTTGLLWVAAPSVATDPIFTTKGDVVAATGSATAVRIAVGADGTALTADSASAAGVKWDTPVRNLVDAKGDLLAGTADNVLARLAVGTDGQILIADSASTPGVKWADRFLVPANTQTTSYTLVLADAGKSVEENSASATVITVPPNSSVAFPLGTVIELSRIGAGTVTITPGSGVTLPNRLEAAGTSSRTIPNQWSSASIRKRATDVWVLIGDLA